MSSGELPTKIDRITQLLFARRAAESDIAAAKDYLGDTPDADRWQNYVHALLMTNEFVFVD